ncbi:hypothetical protein F4779DRAFT_611071 [Xylariaceae sp. FL0662B]|nr:hypothetical protein F4779DRAFT_611071 [Xylariaceae sp. FL0662B]
MTVDDPAATPAGTVLHMDALIVGAGFSGIAMLYRLRQLGINAKIFEAGSDLGGTWHRNRYPGARTDSEWPFYQLTIPEVYGTFRFSQRFSDHHELRRYFAHVDRVLDIKRDTHFNSRVVDCRWDDMVARWTVRTESDQYMVSCKYLMLCSGVLVRRHVPDLPGLENFAGTVYHSSCCPEQLDVRGKKVALIGTGSTGVQIAQEVGKQAKQLTVFMRRPSYCLPCRQQSVSESQNDSWHRYMSILFKAGRNSASGFPMSGKPDRSFHEYTPEERERHWETLWRQGGFSFIENNYPDAVMDRGANLAAYDFWARKVRARMSDPRKMDLLAPLPADRAPFYMFTKRSPLEMDFYEVMDRPTVELVSLKDDPFDTFIETGVRMEKDGRHIDFDVLLMATGFDAFSGAVTGMGLKNRWGVDLKDYWEDGIRTYLGTMIHGFPNAFMVFAPHAPTAFSNATTLIEMQCDFICSALKEIESSAKDQARKIKSIEPTSAAEDEWVAYINAQSATTLLPHTASWWNAANGAGKKTQMLNYALGIANYEKDCYDRLSGWKGFDVKYWDDDAKTGETVGNRV